ncbi:MAG: glutathione S-transferase family protein [Deltaproteobacteria bacterium]|nr:glutathione S-transferase family protein [Deltaproteobacteria bacterium]
MKLYLFPPSPNAYKIQAVVNELGLTIATETVDLLNGQQRAPNYAALNPNLMMPTLVDGDFVLWESNAIMQYLCSRAPGQTLWPSEPRDQADVSRWQCWQLAHWMPPCGTYLWENMVKAMMADHGAPDTAALAQADERFHRFAPVLNQQLKGKTWLVGNSVTLADFAIGAPLHYADAAKIPLAQYPEIQRWYAGLAERPSWRKAIPQFGIKR